MILLLCCWWLKEECLLNRSVTVPQLTWMILIFSLKQKESTTQIHLCSTILAFTCELYHLSVISGTKFHKASVDYSKSFDLWEKKKKQIHSYLNLSEFSLCSMEIVVLGQSLVTQLWLHPLTRATSHLFATILVSLSDREITSLFLSKNYTEPMRMHRIFSLLSVFWQLGMYPVWLLLICFSALWWF